MRALIKDKPVRGATLADLPMPEIGEEDLLVRVQTAAICGTDIHIYQLRTMRPLEAPLYPFCLSVYPEVLPRLFLWEL